ncbi:MAG: hypothetical protein ACT4QG_05815 [Sporichthyaceae bacterium]
MARLPDRIPGRVSVVVVAVIAVVATVLLVRTERNAASIHDKTSNIASSSRGINGYTDSLAELERTNELAAKIAAALKPLAGPVDRIDGRTARVVDLLAAIRASTSSIDDSAAAIDASAATIRTGLEGIGLDAKTIQTRVGGLNADAALILGDLTRIQRGVRLINADLPTTARILDGILAEARNILTALGTTERLAGCIDRGLNGSASCPSRGTS